MSNEPCANLPRGIGQLLEFPEGDRMDHRLQSNTHRFPSETIDGETILIDSEKGVLFLLSGLGPWIWNRFTGGADRTAVIEAVAAAFGEPAAATTATFIDSLVASAMLVVSEATSAEAMPLPESFVAPAMEIFEDISEIIMMDPIHEVDPSAGWPISDPDAR